MEFIQLREDKKEMFRAFSSACTLWWESRLEYLKLNQSPELSEVQQLLMISRANKYKVWVIIPPLCVKEKINISFILNESPLPLKQPQGECVYELEVWWTQCWSRGHQTPDIPETPHCLSLPTKYILSNISATNNPATLHVGIGQNLCWHWLDCLVVEFHIGTLSSSNNIAVHLIHTQLCARYCERHHNIPFRGLWYNWENQCKYHNPRYFQDRYNSKHCAPLMPNRSSFLVQNI